MVGDIDSDPTMKNIILILFLATSLSVFIRAEVVEKEAMADADKDFPMRYHKILKDRNGKKVEILLEMKAFDRKAHKIEYNTNGYDGKWLLAKPDSRHPFRVDGSNALGTDGGIPSRELKTFRIIWNGKLVKIPRSLWGDCFSLAMWTPEQRRDKSQPAIWGITDSQISAFGHSVMISSYGGGGAGSYRVIWIIHSDGRCARFFEDQDS